MNRDESLNDKERDFLKQIHDLHNSLDNAFKKHYNRSLPFNETIIDRWDRARKLGFGENTSVYDSVMILGNVEVGKSCWIGPYSIIDGSGGLVIGDNCTISAGVHIYSHDNVVQTLTSGKVQIEREQVRIGNNVYIGPNAVITKGVEIGDFCVIGAFAFVNRSIKSNSIVIGQPGKIVGEIDFKNGVPIFRYFH